MRRTHITVLALLLPILLAGCATRGNVPSEIDPPRELWKEFRATYAQKPHEPAMAASGILYYSRTKPIRRSNRTRVRLWGDFGAAQRMDVAAGIGKILAHIREDADGLMILYPSEKVAYVHSDPVQGAAALGLAVPFSVNDLMLAVSGSFAGLVPESYSSGKKDNGGCSYEFAEQAVSALTLDHMARPVFLKGSTRMADGTDMGWTASFEDWKADAEGNETPETITFVLESGEKGILKIRSLERKKNAWPEQSLSLDLPEEVRVYDLQPGRHSEDK